MQKTIDLGKIDYNGNGRKINRVTLDLKFENGRFSLCGNIWNGRETDILSGGQNLEEIAKFFPHDAKVQRMVQVWRRYHLNDLRAGSPAQEAFLRENPVTFVYPDSYYLAASRALLNAGLNPDPNFAPRVNGNNQSIYYVYGSAWVKEEIPDDVSTEILSW